MASFPRGMSTYLRKCRCVIARPAGSGAAWGVVVLLAATCPFGSAQDIGRFPESVLQGEAPGVLLLDGDDEGEILTPGAVAPDRWPDRPLPPAQPNDFPSLTAPVCEPWLGMHRGCCAARGGCFTHSFPDDPARHVGLGQPLYGTSWLNRPYSTGLMLGGVIADASVWEAGELGNGFLVALHQGYDFDHYFGGELRIAAGKLGVSDSATESSDGLLMVGLHLMHYPWGDSLWRPYYSVGLGFARHSLTDNFGRDVSETLVNIPLGIGLKYQWQRHCALRLDVTHNIHIGAGAFDTMDIVSISAGAEWHYGGTRKSYFPWNPSLHH